MFEFSKVVDLVFKKAVDKDHRNGRRDERVAGIEPAYFDWQPNVLPLYYTRMCEISYRFLCNKSIHVKNFSFNLLLLMVIWQIPFDNLFVGCFPEIICDLWN